ncbi:MAG: hypothetical protein E7018_04400 [Alphaproteobacteria bacterium]|nr:hypothetical protein [Alphaproteobacteria bacterium]
MFETFWGKPTETLLQDNRFYIDQAFFDRILKGRIIVKSELTTMRVGDIKRKWLDGTIMNLQDVGTYKYLCGDTQAYQDYCLAHKKHFNSNMKTERFDTLIKSLDEKGYDPKSIIILDFDNVIMDGSHRSSYLLHKYGPDFQVNVLRLKTKKRFGDKVKKSWGKIKQHWQK